MSLMTMEDLLREQIQDVYSAEQQLLAAIPGMADAANSLELQEAFEEHLNDTLGQIERLDDVCDILGIAIDGEPCEGMAGIIREAQQVIDEDGDPDVKDAALIAVAQRVEHYEIAAYGTICQLADNLDEDDAKKLLGEILENEKKTDKKLTKLAEGGIFSSGINEQALEEEEEF
jgi:ferritin-like metal-binding protein YciE